MRTTQRRLPAVILTAAVHLTSVIAAASAFAAAEPAAAGAADSVPSPAAGSAVTSPPAAEGDAAGKDLKLPPQEEIEKHKTYDSGPDLQQTPGGGLVVNAFIMDGPVQVEVRDRDSGKLLIEKKAGALFPFEVPRRQLGVEPTRVVVRIYVKGKLVHELTMLPGH